MSNRMRSLTKIKALLPIAVVVFLSQSIESRAMAGLFGSETLFSKVDIEVIVDGGPSKSTTVQQKIYRGRGEEVVAEAQTDDQGKTTFREISESKGLLGFLPSEFVVTQRLMILHEGQEYLGWAHTKRSPEKNEESEGKAFSLICDLSKPAEEDDIYHGICRLRES